MFRLDLCEGPTCSRCGCNDTKILQRPPALQPGEQLWWAAGRAKCRFCGAAFSFRQVPAERPPIAVASPQIEVQELPPVVTRRRR
jgi:hypothetical protein